MFERSVGNATRRVNVTPFYVWTCNENYNLVVRFGIIFIIKTEFCISFSSRKTTKKSITILVHFFKQFLKTDSGYGAMGIFCTQCF
ncbi:hypothetical protein DMI48_00315 [Shigella boydii]|nr:hypothetical protein [Shigella boydii]EGE1638918.1 hypothetical protein [Shigella boydii]